MAFFLLLITMYRPTRHRQELPPSLTDTLTLPHLNTDKTEEFPLTAEVYRAEHDLYQIISP